MTSAFILAVVVSVNFREEITEPTIINHIGFDEEQSSKVMGKAWCQSNTVPQL